MDPRDLLGSDPSQLTADEGYDETIEAIHAPEQRIVGISIARQRKRTAEELERERGPLFRLAQAFRAAIDGTISFLERAPRRTRCFDTRWGQFTATVGTAISGHHSSILPREPTPGGLRSA